MATTRAQGFANLKTEQMEHKIFNLVALTGFRFGLERIYMTYH